MKSLGHIQIPEDRELKNVFLGVDGGGSSSQAALWMIDDTNEPLFIDGSSFGSLSLKSSTEDEVFSSAMALKGFIDSALKNGIEIECAAFGLSGLDDPQDLADISRIFNLAQLSQGLPKQVPYGYSLELTSGSKIVLCSDALLPLFGNQRAFGAVLIAGTGSISYAVLPSGEMVRFGGWGYRTSDEGSGQWVGCEFLRHALHAAEDWVSAQLKEHFEDAVSTTSAGIEHVRIDDMLPSSLNPLPQIVVDALNATRSVSSSEMKTLIEGDSHSASVQPLFDWSMSHTSPKDFAALARSAFESGSEEALSIKEEAAKKLARLAWAACSCFEGSDDEDISGASNFIAIGGGLFNNDGFKESFGEELSEYMHKKITVLEQKLPPTFGAAAIAAHLKDQLA